jgi:hypothetical protein
MFDCPRRTRDRCDIRDEIDEETESVFRPLLDFGVLNDNLIKGLILCIK